MTHRMLVEIRWRYKYFRITATYLVISIVFSIKERGVKTCESA